MTILKGFIVILTKKTDGGAGIEKTFVYGMQIYAGVILDPRFFVGPGKYSATQMDS
jgi:hypothetical protein